MKASTTLRIILSLRGIVNVIHIDWLTCRYIVLMEKAIHNDIKEFRDA